MSDAPTSRRVRTVKRDHDFLSSGSDLFNLALGGGYPFGRMVNIIGDKSTGKTLLAIEACANFVAMGHDVSRIRYVEPESSFSVQYARTMGLPVGVVPVGQDTAEPIRTVEAWQRDMSRWLKDMGKGQPCLYILDSLDALTDEGELERDISDGSFGGKKPKLIGELFRREIGNLMDAKCLLVIISQVRDKIGVTFGETKTRSGGRALDFYAGQLVWLTEIGKEYKEILGKKRVRGITVRAQTRKNKVGLASRECTFKIIFGYGIDDEISMLEWLKENRGEELLSDTPLKIRNQLVALRKAGDRPGLAELHKTLVDNVRAHWQRIEDELAPSMRKYE